MFTSILKCLHLSFLQRTLTSKEEIRSGFSLKTFDVLPFINASFFLLQVFFVQCQVEIKSVVRAIRLGDKGEMR